MKRILHFLADERGAVTVDWVVLTAALIGAVIAMFTILTPGIYREAGAGISERVAAAGEVALGE